MVNIIHQNNTTTKPLNQNKMYKMDQKQYLHEVGQNLADLFYNQNKMTREEIKNDISVKSRLVGMSDEQLKIIDFIIDYSFKDKEEVYTNGTILVPLFRVLDAIRQEGKEYQESC